MALPVKHEKWRIVVNDICFTGIILLPEKQFMLLDIVLKVPLNPKLQALWTFRGIRRQFILFYMQPRLVFKIKAASKAIVWCFFNEGVAGPETQLRHLDLFYGSPEKRSLPNQNNLPMNDF